MVQWYPRGRLMEWNDTWEVRSDMWKMGMGMERGKWEVKDYFPLP